MTDATDRLSQTERLDLYAIEIDVATPLRFCTGFHPFIYDSDTYWPRGMRIGRSVPSTQSSQARQSLIIDARPAEGETDSPFAPYLADNSLQNNTEVVIHQFVWSADGQWGNPVSSVTWYCQLAGGAPGYGGDHVAVKLTLSAYVGFMPGRGLSRGESGCDLVNDDNVMCFAASACSHTFSTCQDTDAYVGNRWAIEDQKPIVLGGRTFQPSGPKRAPIRWRWVKTPRGPRNTQPCKLAPPAIAK